MQARGDNKVAEQYFRDSLALYLRLGLRVNDRGRPGDERAGHAAQLSSAATMMRRSSSRMRSKSIGARSVRTTPRVIMETHNLAFALQAQGEFAAADPLFRQVHGADAPRIRARASVHDRRARRTTGASCATRATSWQRKRHCARSSSSICVFGPAAS